MKKLISYSSALLASAFLSVGLQGQAVFAEQVTPGFNNTIPPSIMTPDKVETRIGTLDFFDGMPSRDTVQKVYDNLDFMRGVEVFLNFIPATSVEGVRRGMQELGATVSNQCVIMDKLMDSDPLFLTGNTDTVYASIVLDLEKDGATVVEIPPKCGPGTVNDAYFRFVTDMGIPGPDKGKGGIYVILPPDYKGDLDPPEGGMEAEMKISGKNKKVFVSKSPSFTNWLILRGFLVDGKPDIANRMFKSGLKVYSLSKAANPPVMEFISGSDKVFNTIHGNNYDFYEELNHVIQKEPIGLFDPEIRGLAAAIGIQKGKEFSPDERIKNILTEAVAVGNATARAMMFDSREPNTYKYENSYWFTPFIGGSHKWLKNEGRGGRYLDARTLFFYGATVNTPAMTVKMVGKGSQYAYNARDNKGNYLDGSKTYRLNIPANVPAKDFWSVVAYDPQTRSQLQTGQEFPSRNNKRDNLSENIDGSVDLYFGPETPVGKESNWIETVPGKGWMVLIRLYGPLDAWFDKTWQPGEFERVD